MFSWLPRWGRSRWLLVGGLLGLLWVISGLRQVDPVTEYGVVEDDEEVEYASRIPFLFETRGLIVERWYWYSWNDPTLGFELRKGPSPLWRELQ